MINRFFFCLFSLSFFLVNAQEKKSSDPFLNHLLNMDLQEDAIYYLESALSENPTFTLTNDSIHYVLGKLYESKDLQKSTYHFESIDWKNSRLSFEKKKHLILHYLELNELNKIEEVNSFPSQNIWQEPCDSLYLKESLNVLQGTSRMDLNSKCTDYDWSSIKEADSTLTRLRKRSPFMAGALSAVVPGLGKVYAGRSGQGIMAFVTSAVLGWQAMEGYQKGGINDPRFIVFTSLFSITYIGNIWGSALAVSVNYQNHYNESKNAVLASVRFSLSLK